MDPFSFQWWKKRSDGIFWMVPKTLSSKSWKIRYRNHILWRRSLVVEWERIYRKRVLQSWRGWYEGALYALKSDANVVVVVEDCDIFVLLMTFFLTTKPKFKWSVRYCVYKYAKIEDIVKNLGNNACNFHSKMQLKKEIFIS